MAKCAFFDKNGLKTELFSSKWMYTPFNHNFIINLAIMNKLQTFLTFMGKCVYLNFGGQELIKTLFSWFKAEKNNFFKFFLPNSDSSLNSIWLNPIRFGFVKIWLGKKNFNFHQFFKFWPTVHYYGKKINDQNLNWVKTESSSPINSFYSLYITLTWFF